MTKTYDDMDRLSSVEDWLSNTTSFSYDADNDLTGITYGNGDTDTNVFDNADQLSSITDKKSATTLVSFSYTRDDYGDLTAETDTGTPGAGTTDYTNDSLHRLTVAGASDYGYDGANDLTTGPSGRHPGLQLRRRAVLVGNRKRRLRVAPRRHHHLHLLHRRQPHRHHPGVGTGLQLHLGPGQRHDRGRRRWHLHQLRLRRQRSPPVRDQRLPAPPSSPGTKKARCPFSSPTGPTATSTAQVTPRWSRSAREGHPPT